METQCQVAKFICQQIENLDKTQKQIAQEAGFSKPNVISMIKQGQTRLPLAKIGAMSRALETDPVHLLKLCMSTYYPDTWRVIEPLLDSALTADELAMVRAWRSLVGAPYLAALTEDSKEKFKEFLLSLRSPAVLH